MDPLSALGVAANVVQFISFAFELISVSKEIYNSANGSSNKAQSLETAYSHLGELSSSLELSSRKESKLIAAAHTSNIVGQVLAIKDISQICKNDCDRLLELLRKIQGRKCSKNPLRSFTLALKTIWKSSEIADLEQRLQHNQATLTLHLTTLTRYKTSVAFIMRYRG